MNKVAHMNRVECLIKGLQILSKYHDCDVQTEGKGIIFAGPESHKEVNDVDAFELNELGWYTTTFGAWAYNV